METEEIMNNKLNQPSDSDTDLENNLEKNSNSTDSNEIEINIDQLKEKQVNQLKIIKSMVKLTRTYSVYYYYKASIWRKIYWSSSISTLALTTIATIINLFLDSCSNEQAIQKYNILLNTLVTIGLGTITLLNSSVRQKKYEQAGDKYNQLSTTIYREVFLLNTSIIKLNLERIIEKYNIRMDDLMEMYDQPSPEAIDKIMHSKRLDIAIKLKHNELDKEN